MELTEWRPDDAVNGALTRWTTEGVKVVALFGGRTWRVVLAPGRHDVVESHLEAPSRDMAMAYADDFLHRLGFTGPGVSPLPGHLPAFRDRERLDDGVRARCVCGYTGAIILNFHTLCPACGGAPILTPEVLAGFSP